MRIQGDWDLHDAIQRQTRGWITVCNSDGVAGSGPLCAAIVGGDARRIVIR